MCPGMVRGHLVSRLPFVTARGVVVSTIGTNKSHRRLRREVHRLSVRTKEGMGRGKLSGGLLRLVTTSPTFGLALRSLRGAVGPRGCIKHTDRRMSTCLGGIVHPLLRGGGRVLNIGTRVGM